MRALRYLAGYVIPAASLASVLLGGAWTLLAPVVAFGLLPLVELVVGASTANLAADAEGTVAADPAYDLVLRLALPVQLVVLCALGWQVRSGGLTGAALVGGVVAAGLSCG